MRAVRYAFQEAVVSLRRSGRSAIMSATTIAIAFLTLGLFLLAAANLQHVVDRWSAAAEMSIYLRDDATEAARERLRAELAAHQAVEAVEYVDREQALARFRTDFPELADLAAEGDDNPFPASIEVRLRTDPASAGSADAMADLLRAREGVADIRYDRQWLSRLTAIVRGVRVAGFAITAVLILGAAFTVAAVVRLSLQARREELDIMQLVGAPLAFIRGPSIAEGMLLGGVGAAVSLAALWALFATVRGRLHEAMSGLVNAGEVRFLGLDDSLLLLVAGLLVGALAGMVTARAVR
jgi:cell division transport system permease protein